MRGIQKIAFGQSEQWILNNGRIQIGVLPDFGGAINQFKLLASNKNPVINFIWGYTDEEEAKQQHLNEYRGAKLSPSPNRTKSGQFHFLGQSYQMPINFPYGGHQIHGCLADARFDVIEYGTTEGNSNLTIAHNYQGDYPGFPFSFRVEIEYQLHRTKGFSCQTRVINTGRGQLPIGDGWHPYFHINGLSINELQLQMPECEELQVDERMIPTGEALPFRKFQKLEPINDYHFDDCFRIDKKGQVSTKLYAPSLGMEMDTWQNAGLGEYRYLQIYTPDNRKTIAIEPMTCPPDALNSQQDLLVLQPKEEACFNWGCSVSLVEWE